MEFLFLHAYLILKLMDVSFVQLHLILKIEFLLCRHAYLLIHYLKVRKWLLTGYLMTDEDEQ